MRLYIAGPMTGIPQFNVPLFDEVAAKLRAEGHEVVSPAELDSPEMRAFALASSDGIMPPDGKIVGESWGDMLARDVRVIHDQVDSIAVLPGWYKSRGARLEVFVGLLTGKTFFGWSVRNNQLITLPREMVQQVIRDNMP